MPNLISKRSVLALLGSAPACVATFASAAGFQEGWRWCRKCQGLWFAGNNTNGACPAGGGHVDTESGSYRLAHNSPGSRAQHGWRWCRKCQGVWFAGNQTEGICPAGGAHSAVGSGDYGLDNGGPAVAAPMPDELVGIWSAQARTRGGLGAQFVFNPSGEAIHTFGALVDFTCEIDGDRLTTVMAEAAQTTRTVELIAIEGDKLTLTPTSGQTPARVFSRIGRAHPDAHPIIGDWSSPHYTGKPSITRFTRNGIFQLSVPFQTRKGRYRGGTQQVDFEGNPPTSITVRREGNVLITTDSAGKEGHFSKFEY